MRFIDEVKIHVTSGTGGHGCMSFRREKFIPKGGPDGGNGGRGGNIYFQSDVNLNTLMHFRGRKNYLADNGKSGEGSQCDGKMAEDMVLRVPVGTIIREQETNRVIADLSDPDEKILIAKGGRGGLGNMFFKTSTNQAPRHHQEGEPGEELDLFLELKLLADVALIGLPNAGKSTLISSLSAAKPKIADYPFTTVEPNLGVVKHHENSIVVADIPGLIEDAAEGKGLGIKFLKHIERTSLFVHLIDTTLCINEYEAYEFYVTIRQELEKYNPELLNKKEIICLSKSDALTEEELQKYKDFFEMQLDKKVLPISASSGLNLDQLKNLMFKAKELIQ